jgi:hypothetical protein
MLPIVQCAGSTGRGVQQAGASRPAARVDDARLHDGDAVARIYSTM